MLFSSIPFLYYFLPVVLIVYFAVPKRLKNLVLLLASLFFYFWGERMYTILMLVTIVSSYVHGLLIDHFRGKVWSKVFLVTSIVSSIAVLGYFKYADFFISNFNAMFHTDTPLLKVALPIGISFYTFQTLSYTIDVYWGTAAVQKNPLKLATYVALFPQLIAGPIVRYTTVEEDLTSRTHSFEKFSSGMGRFIIGLSKKFLLADAFGGLCETFKASDEKSFLFYWIYAIAFCLHIYFDFSGYSDMAIGLGRIFGFRFLENFNYPYISKSVSEFWRRWHISLGSWFRDYVYIPLGGNRVSMLKWLRNILVVWFLTGFWHGADWTFIIWGLYFAVFLVLEKLFLAKWLKKAPSFVSHIYVIFVIIISFVIFNADGLSGAISDLKGLFMLQDIPVVTEQTLYYLRSYAVLFILGLIGVTPLAKTLVEKANQNEKAATVIKIAAPVVELALLVVVTGYLVDGSFSPFLYFRF